MNISMVFVCIYTYITTFLLSYYVCVYICTHTHTHNENSYSNVLFCASLATICQFAHFGAHKYKGMTFLR